MAHRQAQSDPDPDADLDAGDPAQWTSVDHTRRKATPGIVLSLRMSSELAHSLQALARLEQTTTSDLARRLLTDAVTTTWLPASLSIHVTDRLSVTYSHGPRTTGGESKLRTAQELLPPAQIGASPTS